MSREERLERMKNADRSDDGDRRRDPDASPQKSAGARSAPILDKGDAPTDSGIDHARWRSCGEHAAQPSHILPTGAEGEAMKPEEIKVGRFYRFKQSNVVYAITAEWLPTGDRPERELAYFVIGHDKQIGTEERRQTAAQIAEWCSCEAEVRFKWIEPDPRQGDVEAKIAKSDFIGGLLGG